MAGELQAPGYALIIAFTALGTTFCVLRAWSRFLLNSGTWGGLMMWSDIMLFIAWLFSIGEALTQSMTTKTWHFGYLMKDIAEIFNDSPDEIMVAQLWGFTNQLLYNPILSFIKLSMLLLYLRLGGNKPKIRIACYSLSGLIVALMVGIFFADLFQCQPFRYTYDFSRMDKVAQIAAGADANGMVNGVVIKGGQCIKQVEFFLSSAAFTTLTDLFVLAVPIFMVYDLQMQRKKKIIVVAMLSMGIIITGVSIVRLPLLKAIFDPNNKEPLYTVGQTLAAIETGLAMCTACAPDLYPLLSRMFPKVFSTQSGPSQSAYAKNNARPTRKGYMVSSSSHAQGGSRLDGSRIGAADAYAMDDLNWNNERYPKGPTVTVKGGTSDSGGSRSGSQEAIVSTGLEGKNRIIKTTHFVVEDEEDSKRWSNV